MPIDNADVARVFEEIADLLDGGEPVSRTRVSQLQFDNLRFGLGQARRGWIEAPDCLNTH